MRTNHKFSLAAALVLCVGMGTAPVAGALPANLSWNFAGWSGGGAFPAIVPHPSISGKVFVISDVAGVWSTDNRGDQWTYRTTGLANTICASLAVAKSDPSIMYLGTDVGVHKSTDGGNTWTYLNGSSALSVYRPGSYRSIIVDRANADLVYIGTKTGEVHSSSDGGATWSRVGTAQYPFGFATELSALYKTRDGRYLLAGGLDGLRRYDFQTGIWTTISVNGNQVTDMVGFGFTETIYITYGDRVARSTDAGTTWSYSSALPVWNSKAYRLSVTSDAQGNTKILVGWRDGWNGGVVMSADNGVNWTNIERNLNHDVLNDPTRTWAQGMNWPLSVEFDPNDANTMYFSDFWGIWRTTDNGQSWYEKIQGTGNTVGSDIAVGADGAVYVGTMDNGLMRSTDGGASFVNLVPNANLNTMEINGHVWRVAVNGSRIIATNSPWNAPANQILLSNDGGTTFTQVKSGLPTSYPTLNTTWDKGYARALAVDPQNTSRVYLGIDGDNGGGLFISDNGGASWYRSSGQPGSLRIYNGLAVDPLEPRRLYWAATGGAGGVYRSEDYGATWSRVFSANTWVFDLVTASNGNVYAAAGGPNLYVSTNKGASWTLLKYFDVPNAACEAIAVDPTNPNRIAVATVLWGGWTPNKVFMTEDAGATWTDITANLPNGSGMGAMRFSNDGTKLYAARYSGTMYKIDLGASAADTLPPSTPANVAATSQNDQVNITWSASTDNVSVTGYSVYRNGTFLANTASNSYTDTAVTANTSYAYAVRAFDAANNLSPNSATVNVTTQSSANDTQAPSIPSGLTATVSGSQVSLSWIASTDNVGVTGYRVYRSGVMLTTVTATSYADTATTVGSTYSYTVRAIDAAGNASADSSAASATVTSSAPTSAPLAMTASYDAGQNRINLDWEAPAAGTFNVLGYNIYKNGGYMASVGGSWGWDGTLTQGATYTYTVRAYNGAAALSDPSAPVSVTVGGTTPPADTQAPSVPSGVVASIQGSAVGIVWSAATDNVGVTGYTVFRNGAQLGQTVNTAFTDSAVSAGQTYAYTVTARDAAGNNSGASAASSVTIPSAPVSSAPQNLIATYDAAAVRVNMTWNPPAAGSFTVAGYNILKNGAYLGSVNSTTAWDGTLTPGASYSYTVQAFNAAGAVSDPSAPSVVVIPSAPAADTSAPSAPSALTSVLSGSQVNLGWVASTDNVGVTGYTIYRNSTAIGTTTGTNYSDTSVAAGSSYTYTVKARDAANNFSADSNATSISVPAATPTNVPANLTASFNASQNRVNLSWTAPSTFSAVGYNVFRDGVYFGSVASTWAWDGNLTPGATYTYTCRAYNISGTQSGVSNAVQVTIPGGAGQDTTPPSMPGNFTAVLNGLQVTLGWIASTDNVAVTGYNIIRDGATLATTTATSFLDTTVQAGSTYSYTVKARDAAGNESASTSPRSISVITTDTTPPTAPTNVAAAVQATQIALTWTRATDNVGVVAYNVFRNGSYLGTVTGPYYNDSAVTAGQTYSYQVEAYDQANNIGPRSATVTASFQVPPQLLSVSATNITRNEARMNWSTNVPTRARINYSMDDPNLSQSVSTTAFMTSDSIVIYGLQRARTYYYQITVTDANGGTSSSAVKSFRTRSI